MFRRRLTIAMLTLANLAGAHAGEVDPFEWFVADQTYHLRIDHLSLEQSVDARGIETRMASAGHDVDIVDGRSLRGWQLAGEMRIRPWLGVELGMTRLEGSEPAFSAVTDQPGAMAESLSDNMPVVASSVLLGATSSTRLSTVIPAEGIANRIRLRGRIGFHRWEGTTIFEAGSETAREERSGTSAYIGLGLGFEVSEKIEGLLEYQQFGADENQAGLSLGLRFQFW